MSQDLSQAILGIWSTDPEDSEGMQAFGEVVLYFHPDGRLVYDHVNQCKAFLTWRIEGNLLITDQPSHPREARETFDILLNENYSKLYWKSSDQVHPERFARAIFASLIMPGTFSALLNQAQELLVPHDYIRQGQSFLTRRSNNWGIITFTEIENQQDIVKFKIDIGTYSHCVAEFMFARLNLNPPGQPEYSDCHWKQSVLDNLNDPMKVEWWSLLPISSGWSTAESPIHFFTEIVTQALFEVDKYLTDAQLKEYWLSGGGPEISKFMSRRFASILLKASGDKEQLENVLECLEGNSKRHIIMPHLCQIRGEKPDAGTTEWRNVLLGTWITHPEDEGEIQEFGEETLYFAADGRLIYEIGESGKRFLTWRIEGSMLITDDPTYPRKGRIEFYLVADNQMITISPEGYILSYQKMSNVFLLKS